MNDNAPESERWLPVKATERNVQSVQNVQPALDRARREDRGGDRRQVQAHLVTRRPRRRRRAPRNRSFRQWAGIAAIVAVAAVVGGPELATRVYDAIDGGLPGQTQTASGTLQGPVTRIVDGDTFHLGNQAIRLCGVNSPERNEPGFAEASDNLERMISGQTLECRQVGNGTPCDGRSSTASYDRIVAQCFVGGRDIAAEQVRAGHATDWTRYSGGYYGR